jgi:hypothetical protein
VSEYDIVLSKKMIPIPVWLPDTIQRLSETPLGLLGGDVLVVDMDELGGG